MMRRVLWALCSVLALGCEQALPDIGWERMLDQQRGKAYRASPYFPDGKLMQAPPDGTVPANRTALPQPVREGLIGDQYVSTLPVPTTRALLDRGRNRFETFCAACHGIDGSGESIVAHNMELRRPPPLVTEPVRAFPVGRVFQVISAGYGLMPSYAAELSVHERWAVVAYLRALQRSQGSALASLPDAVRKRAEGALP
jgi:mono/diheme cytochrome c family protein